jgi:Ca2+-binding EF-hand superfamily protein
MPDVGEERRARQKLRKRANKLSLKAAAYGCAQSKVEKQITAQREDSKSRITRKIRQQLAANGASGLVELHSQFKKFDKNADGKLTLKEFEDGLYGCGVNVESYKVKQLFESYDTNQDGVLDFREMLHGLRGKLSKQRKKVVRRIFDAMDKDKTGSIDRTDLIIWFDADRHIDVQTRKYTAEEVRIRFLKGLCHCKKDENRCAAPSATHQPLSPQLGDRYSKNTRFVTKQEFERYYGNVSASIDSDQYFEKLLCGVWGRVIGSKLLAHYADKWKEEPTKRSVSVVHQNGTTTVHSVPADINFGADDPRFAAAMSIVLHKRGIRAQKIVLHNGSEEDIRAKDLRHDPAWPDGYLTRKRLDVTRGEVPLAGWSGFTSLGEAVSLDESGNLVGKTKVRLVMHKLREQTGTEADTGKDKYGRDDGGGDRSDDGDGSSSCSGGMRRGSGHVDAAREYERPHGGLEVSVIGTRVPSQGRAKWMLGSQLDDRNANTKSETLAKHDTWNLAHDQRGARLQTTSPGLLSSFDHTEWGDPRGADGAWKGGETVHGTMNNSQDDGTVRRITSYDSARAGVLRGALSKARAKEEHAKSSKRRSGDSVRGSTTGSRTKGGESKESLSPSRDSRDRVERKSATLGVATPTAGYVSEACSTAERNNQKAARLELWLEHWSLGNSYAADTATRNTDGGVYSRLLTMGVRELEDLVEIDSTDIAALRLSKFDRRRFEKGVQKLREHLLTKGQRSRSGAATTRQQTQTERVPQGAYALSSVASSESSSSFSSSLSSSSSSSSASVASSATSKRARQHAKSKYPRGPLRGAQQFAFGSSSARLGFGCDQAAGDSMQQQQVGISPAV